MPETITPVWEYLLRLRHVTVEEIAIAVLPEKANNETITKSEIQALHEAVYQSDNDDQWHKAILIYECLTRAGYRPKWKLTKAKNGVYKNVLGKDYDIVDLIRFIYVHTGNRDLIPQPVIDVIVKIFKAESEQQTEPDDKPKDKLNHKPNAHTERYAKNREQVLGAAIAVMAQFPEQCKNDKGHYEATKIREMIDEKGLLFWPETGSPPLSPDVIVKELRKWLKKTGD